MVGGAPGLSLFGLGTGKAYGSHTPFSDTLQQDSKGGPDTSFSTADAGRRDHNLRFIVGE